MAFTVGILGYLIAWELIGHFRVFGSYVPSLSEIVVFLMRPGSLQSVVSATATTALRAAMGLVYGVLAAMLLATSATVWSFLAPGIDRFTALANALPAIVIGPLLLATVPRDSAPVILSGLVVTFMMYVPVSAGYRSASEPLRDVFTVFGASKFDHWRRLQLPGALPHLVAGLKVAAPTALLGAVLAEWFGSERGLGPLLVNAMQNFQITLLWSAALACTILSVCAFGIFSWLGRIAEWRFR